MFGFFNRLKLSSKILSLISFTLIIALFFVNFFFNQLFYNVLISKDKDKGKETARTLAQISSNALHRLDYYSLENNVIQLQKNPDILYAKILDLTNVELTPSSRDISHVRNDYLVITEKIFYNFKQIGTVEIGIDLRNSIEQANQYILKMTLASLLIIMLVLTLLYFLIKGIIIRPLVNLMNSVSKISEGDLNQTVPIYSKDEIGKLSKDFNQMSLKLKDNIALTQNILESMTSVIISLDDQFRITKCNSQLKTYFQFDSDDFTHHVLWEKIPFFLQYKDICKEVLKNGQAVRLHREAMKNKEDCFFELFIYPLKTENLSGLVIRLDDVSEVENKDSQLRQAQKLETVGTLAGGLAHDFNNVLCGIIGTISLLKFKYLNEENFSLEMVKRLINTIEQASNRAEDMVQQFLALSRKQELKFSKIDLNQSINHVANICNNTFDKCVKIETNLCPIPAFSMADITQVEQVLLNLSINAYHAMTIMKESDQGGVLKISVEQILVDKYFRKTHPEAMDINYWKVMISDTGVGIDRKYLSKIFDPFFTTKDKGQGTGLGLTMVYNIVKQHNGFIDIYSEVGIGTNFILYFPQMQDLEGSSDIDSQPQEIFYGNGEKILIVDDEILIQQIAKDILEECNYQTILASDGVEAIEIYSKMHQQIDLVVLDMLMPRKAGKETYLEMKQINPNVKVLLCSGFKKDERVEKIMSLGVKHFMQKPYTLTKLSEMVKTVLQE